jgi:large subunit ribosomal protein L11
VKQIYEIAKIKQKDDNMEDISLQSICRCIAGSASTMGIKVVK